jgi:UDP-GlcNAc:undecaprenyl-phosphate GlcNAc-1-phosphate transferase
MGITGAAIFASTFIAGLILVGLARGVSRRIGFVDRPGGRKAHREPIPYGGGAAMFAAFAGACLAGLALAHAQPGLLPEGIEGFIATHRAGMLMRSGQVLSMLAGGFVLLAMGVADDARALSPNLKLAVQVGVAAAMVALGHRVTLFIDWPWVGWVVTVIWIVGITNAFNFLDNMDGLSAGVGLVIAVIFAAVAFWTGHLFIGAALLAMAGALGGFLVFNWHPASIFMGDGGSLFIGFTLAMLAVDNTFYHPTGAADPRWFVVVMPLALFAVPIYDVASVTVIRLRRGQSPFVGDRSHFSHRLVERGLAPWAAVLVIYLATMATAGTLLVLVGGPAFALVQTAAVVLLLGILEHVGRGGGGDDMVRR